MDNQNYEARFVRIEMNLETVSNTLVHTGELLDKRTSVDAGQDTKIALLEQSVAEMKQAARDGKKMAYIVIGGAFATGAVGLLISVLPHAAKVVS